jgi:subtilase family serine protease
MALSYALRLQEALLRMLTLALIAAVSLPFAHGQATPHITQQIDARFVTPLKGSVHPLVRHGAGDLGAVPNGTPTGRITLLLKRPQEQEQALQQFLTEVHRKGSPNYHKWLTPAQFGQQFGVADSDMSAVRSWLESQGLKVEKTPSGKNVIQFSGTAGQVGAAFHTSLHTYAVNGQIHHANSSELKIPAALSPVIAAIGPLNDFYPKSLSRLLGTAEFNPKNHQLTPQFTLSVPGYSLGLAPEDLATQYDIAPLYSRGVTGIGQTIGIINDSNIDLSLVAAYRKLFKLDADPSKPNLPQVVVDGNDPGVNGDSIEAYLDVEVSGAIAPQATVRLYVSAGSDYSDGLSLAVVRAVEDDSASVLSLSFGGCEAFNAPFGDAFFNSEWEQAAAQGQTVMVSSGDGDSADCDAAGSEFAEFGRQVNGLGSTPWNIAVGGTDFYYPGGLSSVFNFWSQTNDGKNGSLLQSLPEQPWNNSIYGKNLGGASEVVGGGGGQSACAIPGSGTDPLTGIALVIGGSTTLLDCAQYTGYPKPAWQSGPGVPADGVRDLPDISMFAANGDNASFYVTCESAGDCTSDALGSTQLQVTGIGGTSAAAPVFAGVMALVNQRFGPQGQANTVLYPLAQQVPAAFHDVTVGSNNAPCSLTTQLSIECVPDASGGTFSVGGFDATVGYDLASGLGSVDVNQLVANWDKLSFEETRTVLTASSTVLAHGQPVTLYANVTGHRNGDTPTGNVALVTSLPQYASRGLGLITLNAAGDGAITTNLLPGGTYSLTAQYAGNAKYNGSQSAPLSFTISPERSVIRPTTHAYTLSYPGGKITLTDLGPIANGATYPYGTVFFVDLQITGTREAAGTPATPATGSTTLLDYGVPISTNSIDVTGSSSYQNLELPVGRHSFQYAYSGDSSYLPTSQTSPAGPLNFTVTQAPSMITSPQTLPISLNIGGTFVYQVLVSGVGGGVPPTGEVTFTLGNLPPQVVTLRPQVGGSFEQGSGVSYAAVYLANLPAGNYTIKASYPGDQNWGASVLSGPSLTVAGTGAQLPSFTTAKLTSSSGSGPIEPSTVLTLNVSVSGGKGATIPPSGLFLFLDEGTLIGLGVLAPSSSGATSTATISFRGSMLYGGTNQLWVVYAGDSNYQDSFAPLVSYTEHAKDFTLAATTQNVTVHSGNAGVAFLQLQGLNQFSGGVSLTCKVTGGPTGNAVLPGCIVPPVAIVQSIRPSTSIVLVSTELADQHSFGRETRDRDRKPFPQTVPPGTYTAVITGTTGTATHDVTVTIVVQDPAYR